MLKAMKGDTIVAKAKWELRNSNSVEAEAQAGEKEPNPLPEGVDIEWLDSFNRSIDTFETSLDDPHYCEFQTELVLCVPSSS